MPHWNWVCQEKLTSSLYTGRAERLPQQRHCRAKTPFSVMVLIPLFCFTYPLPDLKKASGFQKLPQISSGFLSGLLVLEFFTKTLLKIIICSLAFHEDVSKKPVPLCYCLYPGME